MIVALLVACGGPNVQHDVGGEWYGSFAHEGADAWAVRLLEVEYEGPSNVPEHGAWKEWSGTFEMWGNTDVASVQPWFNDPAGVPIEQLTTPLVLWVCEDAIRCVNEADVYAPGGFLITAELPEATFVSAGQVAPDALNPLSGEAWWSDDADILSGSLALAPTPQGGGTDWDGTFDGSAGGATWTMRLIDLVGIAGVDGWREERGVLELRGDADRYVVPVQVSTCEADACPLGERSWARDDVRVLADANGGTFSVLGALDGDTLAGDGSFLVPGRPSIGPVVLTRASGLSIGDP